MVVDLKVLGLHDSKELALWALSTKFGSLTSLNSARAMGKGNRVVINITQCVCMHMYDPSANL